MRTTEDNAMKLIKAMLQQWGWAKRIEWKQSGTGVKPPAYISMMTPSKVIIAADDPELEGFRLVMIALKTSSYEQYRVANKIYVEEMDTRDIARLMGTTVRTVDRKLQGACNFIRANWSSIYEDEAFHEKHLQACL